MAIFYTFEALQYSSQMLAENIVIIYWLPHVGWVNDESV